MGFAGSKTFLLVKGSERVQDEEQVLRDRERRSDGGQPHVHPSHAQGLAFLLEATL